MASDDKKVQFTKSNLMNIRNWVGPNEYDDATLVAKLTGEK